MRDEIIGGPDCMSCWRREECQHAQAGDFCTLWRSAEPEPREPDPNEQWRRGEEAVF